MPRFRSVSVHPTTNLWGTACSDDPDADAFTKLARGICEAYGDALAGAGVQHSVSSLVLFTQDQPRLPRGVVDQGQTVVACPLDPDPVREFHESAAVRVVAGFAALDPEQQWHLVLDTVHAAAAGLARYRGLAVEAFDAARVAVVRAGPEFSWSSAWRASADGRWRARCSFRTLADGFGRQVLEVSTADGVSSVFSPERVASHGLGDQRRAASSLRWTRAGRVEVSLCTDHRGPGVGVLALEPAPGPGAEMTAAGSSRSLAEAALRGPGDGPDPSVPVPGRPSGADPRLDVLTVLPDPGRREIHGVDAGGSDRVPPAYTAALGSYFEQFEDDVWHEWWSPADRPELQIWFLADGVEAERLVVRRSRTRVVARVERRVESFSGDPVDAAGLARQDVEGLLAVVQERMRLRRPPELVHPGDPPRWPVLVEAPRPSG